MAVLKLSLAARTALAQALLDKFDAASGPCTIKFYTGAQPAGPGTAVTTQTLLGTLTCSDPMGVAAAGALTFNAVFQDSAADATGTATWARLLDGAGVAQGDFDVTDEAGSGVVKMNTTSIISGGPIQVSSFVITIGGA